MGLDSIELLMEVEKYFQIQIPDREAEKIYTVQNMVDAVASHRGISSSESPLLEKIFLETSYCIEALVNVDKILLSDKVANCLDSGDKELWDKFEKYLNLKVPKPDSYNAGSNKFSDKFKKLINWTPMYDWQQITMEHFVNAICAKNYFTLLAPDKIWNKHEIYIGVMGITVDKIGVDYYEILPEKSFTNDLGVD